MLHVTLRIIALLSLFGTIIPVHASVRDQLDQLARLANGKRIGMITNPSGCDETGRPDVDYLASIPGTTITAFFAPEHGLRGILPAGRGDADYIDPATSIPVFAVYGPRRAPTPEQLDKLDILVFDMQDVGARFYTFTWTMTYCMDAAAKAGKKFVVIDRPNPIGGNIVEGPANTTDFGLIGRVFPKLGFGVATRHGMTIGEIATMWNAETTGTQADLTILKMDKWTRASGWPSDRKYVPPSPNMRTPAAALVYPGTCIFEGTTLSEGRGTDRPFELIGAPFIDAQQYADALTSAAIPGAKFTPRRYTPISSKHRDTQCGGVLLEVTDPTKFNGVRTGLLMLQAAMKLYPDQARTTTSAARLSGIPEIGERLKAESVDAIMAGSEQSRLRFIEARRKYLLYAD